MEFNLDVENNAFWEDNQTLQRAQGIVNDQRDLGAQPHSSLKVAIEIDSGEECKRSACHHRLKD